MILHVKCDIMVSSGITKKAMRETVLPFSMPEMKQEAAGVAKDWAKAFYNSGAWLSTRELALIRDKGICTTPGCFQPAEEVHHKIALTPDNIGDKRIALNLDNLVSLCGECHKRITKRQQTKDSLLLPEITFDDDGYPIEIPPGDG